MNIYYNKIRFIKIWKWWKQLYNAFVKLYCIITEGIFGVCIHKGQIHFLAIPVQTWNSIFKSLTVSQFQSFIIVYLYYCTHQFKNFLSIHQLSIPACAHHVLQRTGTYDHTHSLQGVRAKTMKRNCLPQGRAANINVLLLLLWESILKGETRETSY